MLLDDYKKAEKKAIDYTGRKNGLTRECRENDEYLVFCIGNGNESFESQFFFDCIIVNKNTYESEALIFPTEKAFSTWRNSKIIYTHDKGFIEGFLDEQASTLG